MKARGISSAALLGNGSTASSKGLKLVLGAVWLDTRFGKEFAVSFRQPVVDSVLYEITSMSCNKRQREGEHEQ